MHDSDVFAQLVALERQVAHGQRAQSERDQLIRNLVDSGMRQADAWRAWNEARIANNLPTVTRAAVEAVVRRTKPQTTI